MKSWIFITGITVIIVLVIITWTLSIYGMVESRNRHVSEEFQVDPSGVGFGTTISSSWNTVGNNQQNIKLHRYTVTSNNPKGTDISVTNMLTSSHLRQLNNSNEVDLEVGYEQVGNFVIDGAMDSYEPSILHNLPKDQNQFKVHDHSILLNGHSRGKLSDLTISESADQIKIYSKKKPLIVRADHVFLDDQEIRMDLPKGHKGTPGIDGQGDHGDIGPHGDTGLSGPVGGTGEKGYDGWKGVCGPSGDSTVDGVKGDKGPVGEKGTKGSPVNIVRCYDSVADLHEEIIYPLMNTYAIIRPAPGQPVSSDDGMLYRSDGKSSYTYVLQMNVTGTKGLSGDQGDPSDTPTVGDKGEQGPPSAAGIKGIKGQKGDRGATGQKGLPGTQGQKGIKGDKGTKGEIGLRGNMGRVDQNEFARRSKIVLHVTEVDRERVSVHFTSSVWAWSCMQVYWYTSPSITPTTLMIVNLGSPIEIPSENALFRGVSKQFIYSPPSPVYFAYHNGYEWVNDGPYLVGQDQTITFNAQPSELFVPNKTFELNPPATVTSGLVVNYKSLSENICMNVGKTVNMIAPGDCIIQASQSGDGEYNQAPPVESKIVLYTELQNQDAKRGEGDGEVTVNARQVYGNDMYIEVIATGYTNPRWYRNGLELEDDRSERSDGRHIYKDFEQFTPGTSLHYEVRQSSKSSSFDITVFAASPVRISDIRSHGDMKHRRDISGVVHGCRGHSGTIVTLHPVPPNTYRSTFGQEEAPFTQLDSKGRFWFENLNLVIPVGSLVSNPYTIRYMNPLSGLESVDSKEFRTVFR